MPVIGRRELWLFISVVMLWGVNWPMMKMVLAELDFWVFRTYCVLAGLVWFLGYNLSTGVSLKVPREYWPRLAMSALCNVAGWNIMSAAGLNLLPSGRAGILAYTMPLWVVLLSRFFLGEALTKLRLIAITLGMTGVGLLLIDEFQTLKSAPIGALLMVASGLIWAFGIVLFKGFPKSIPTTTLMIWSFTLGGWPILVGLIAVGHGPWLPTGGGAWAGLLFNVIIVSGFAGSRGTSWCARYPRRLRASVRWLCRLLVSLAACWCWEKSRTRLTMWRCWRLFARWGWCFGPPVLSALRLATSSAAERSSLPRPANF